MHKRLNCWDYQIGVILFIRGLSVKEFYMFLFYHLNYQSSQESNKTYCSVLCANRIKVWYIYNPDKAAKKKNSGKEKSTELARSALLCFLVRVWGFFVLLCFVLCLVFFFFGLLFSISQWGSCQQEDNGMKNNKDREVRDLGSCPNTLGCRE